MKLSSSVTDYLLYSAILLSLALVYADATILSIALPTIQKELNSNITNALWVVNSYMLIRAVFVFAAGRLSDIYTHIRVFLFGIIVLILASLGCGLTNGIFLLILFRAFQGLGATLIFVSGMSLITLYAPENRKARRISLMFSISLAGMAIGPVLGGSIIHYASWRWIFFANVILGVFALLGSIPTLHHHARPLEKGRFDWKGFILSVLFTSCFTIGFQNSNSWGWGSLSCLSFLLLGMLSLAIFIYVELHEAEPLIQLTLLSHHNFLSSCLIGSFTQVSIMLIVFVSIFFQNALGYSPMKSGIMILPMIGTGMLFANVGGWLADYYGAKLPLILGTGCAVLGFILTLTFFSPISYNHLLPLLVFSGIGMFMINGPIRAALLSQTNVRQHGMVNALLTGFRTIISVLGFSITAAIIINVNYLESYSLLHKLIPTISADEVHGLMGLLSHTPKSLTILQHYTPTLQLQIDEIIRTTYINGFFWALVFVGTLSLISFLLSIFRIHNERKPTSNTLV